MKKLFVAPLIITAALLSLISCATPDIKKTESGGTIYSSDAKSPEKRAHIEGRVTESNENKGIAGAVVEIKNSNRGIGYYKTTTDSRGYYRVDDFIPNIRYDIEVTAPGYVSYNETLQISAVENNIVLSRESIITGTVRDSRGTPVPETEVKLTSYDEYSGSSGNRPEFIKTDSAGNYSFPKLKSGSYMLSFEKGGYISETAHIQQVREGETFRLQMVLYRPSSFSGNITISGVKAPAAGINITARGRHIYTVESFHDGSFNIEDVKPGRYQLELSHQGFHNIKSQFIDIREGEQKGNLNFEIATRSPDVKIHSYRTTFTPGNQLDFNLRSLRLDTVKIRVYRVPVKFFLTAAPDPDSLDPVKSGFTRVTEWDEPVKDFRPYEWMYYSVNINQSLPVGGYCIEVQGSGSTPARQFFTVTNIGVVLKKSPDRIYAYVTDLVQNKPVKDASIIAYDHSGRDRTGKQIFDNSSPSMIEQLPLRELAKGTTDSDGIFSTPLKHPRGLSLLVLSKDGSYAIAGSGSSSFHAGEKEKFFIYTDRPVYRAGDRVHFKVIAKDREGRFVPIKNRDIFFKAGRTGSEENQVTGELILDDWGTAEGVIDIPSDSELGLFSINTGFARDNLYGSGTFHVEQYRKPEFKIDIEPSKSFFINGDTAEFRVEAKYFFGAPIKDALVKYRFYERRIETADLSYNDESSTGRSYSRIRLEGEKYADSSGTALLRLAAGTYPYDREITLEATVTDRSNISITSRRTVKVGRGEFFIKVEPEENFFNVDGNKKIKISAISHSGKPVSAAFDVNLFKYIWKPAQRVYVHDTRPLFSRRISTGADGTAEISLPEKFSSYGEFDLIVTGKDSRDNRIKGSTILWIYRDSGGDADSKFRNIELSVNKNTINDSGEITSLVKSRFTDSYVWVTLEGRDVYQSKVVKMDKNIVPIKFSVDKKYAPNLFVRAVMQRGRALYTDIQEITIPVEDTRLKISVTPDRDVYSPGETVNIKIKTTDLNNKPQRSDLSLAAVDESIFSIRGDNTPEISSFFYSRISNWVTTTYSYPITLLAGAGKDSQVKVRENFKDTAFWDGKIRTDRNGEAAVSFTIPDNLTTWRLTARGHDLSGRMGEVREKFLSTKDIAARTGKPRFLVEGDRISVIGIVNNNTDSGIKSITTSMKLNSSEIKPDREVKISLPEYGSAREFFTFSVPEGSGEAVIEYSAITDRNKGDIVRQRIPVETRGLSFSMSGSGDMTANRKITLESLKPTDNFEFVPDELVIRVNPSPVFQLLKGVEYLNRYPYGCLEQTINKFIPSVAVKALLSSGNYSSVIPAAAIENLDVNLKEGIRRIQNAQNYDGTWGWWSGDRGNAFITGFALLSLHRAESYDYELNSDTINSALNAIERMLLDPQINDNDETSYLLYVYSLRGRWNHESFKRIASAKNLNSFQAANLILALFNAKAKASLDEYQVKEIDQALPLLRKVITDSAKRDSRGLYWPASGSQSWSWPGGDTEITAHVLSALVNTGWNKQMQSQALTSLSKRFSGEAWGSTKETGTVILAMCDFISSSSAAFTSKGETSFNLNGRKIAEITYNITSGSDLKDLVRTVKISPDMAADKYTLDVSGTASGDMTYTAILKGHLKFKPVGIFSFLKSEKRGIGELSNGISARRDLFYLSRVKDVKMQEYMVPQSLAERGKISVGDELLVRVKFTAQDNFGFLILEDFLPSGFEVIKESAYNGLEPFSRVERWDNRMIFFFTDIKKGEEYEAAYVIRAELPGSFILRPARIGSMYEPSIQGWSLPAVIDVKNEE